MTKILLVDDEPQMVGFLERLFSDSGYSAVSALDGMTALREFFVSRPDVAIVDLLMPHMDGFELCRRIREISHIPIIVLTGLEQVGEKVNAFNAGADDYVCKPVSGPELLARVEACLRRSQRPSATRSARTYSDRLINVDFHSIKINFSSIKIDFDRREVYVNGKKKRLTPIEYSLLTLFVQRPGEASSLEYLLTSQSGLDSGTIELIKWHIKNLRKKLESEDSDS